MSELEIQQDPPPSPDRKAAPKELAYRLRQQRIAAGFGYFALKTEDLDELLQEATRLAAEGLDTSFAKYLRIWATAPASWSPQASGGGRAWSDVPGWAMKWRVRRGMPFIRRRR